jgi:hypothetical protein
VFDTKARTMVDAMRQHRSRLGSSLTRTAYLLPWQVTGNLTPLLSMLVVSSYQDGPQPGSEQLHNDGSDDNDMIHSPVIPSHRMP